MIIYNPEYQAYKYFGNKDSNFNRNHTLNADRQILTYQNQLFLKSIGLKVKKQNKQ